MSKELKFATTNKFQGAKSYTERGLGNIHLKLTEEKKVQVSFIVLMLISVRKLLHILYV